MGEQKVTERASGEQIQTFTRLLLDDLMALERLIDEDRIESGVRRIGAEQEMFLVDGALMPAPISLEVLERAADPRLTTELARFNLEANLTPLSFGGDCLRRMGWRETSGTWAGSGGGAGSGRRGAAHRHPSHAAPERSQPR